MVASLLIASTPPPPAPARKIAQITTLLVVLIVAGLLLLLVSWIAIGILRRRWLGGAGESIASRRGVKDPWKEAGRRANTDEARPRPEHRPFSDPPPPGEEPYQ